MGIGGPWYIAQKSLFLKAWTSGPFEQLSFQMFLVWVKLWHVPLQLFTADEIGHITSAIGNPLYMDKATKERRRISFARVSVEITCEIELQILLLLILRE